jgi:hypothetical protein
MLNLTGPAPWRLGEWNWAIFTNPTPLPRCGTKRFFCDRFPATPWLANILSRIATKTSTHGVVKKRQFLVFARGLPMERQRGAQCRASRALARARDAPVRARERKNPRQGCISGGFLALKHRIWDARCGRRVAGCLAVAIVMKIRDDFSEMPALLAALQAKVLAKLSS